MAAGLLVGVAGAAIGAYGGSRKNTSNGYTYAGGAAMGVGLSMILIGWIKGHSCPKPSKVSPATVPPGQVAEAVSADEQQARAATDQIRSAVHGEIPPAEAVGTNSGGVTTTTVRNGTQYTLYFYLAGPVARSLVISPGQAQNLRLVPGRYEIGARVASPDVTPFYGVQNYGKGTAYSETFYIQAQ
jgi:hypothetical protein